MHISEVIQALKDGKKIRHSTWEKTDFLLYDKEERQVCFFRLESMPFLIEAETLLSEGWESIDGQHKDLDFLKVLSLLAQGHRIINPSDPSYEFLQMDLVSKNISKVQLNKRPFSIDHGSIFSTEWMEVK